MQPNPGPEQNKVKQAVEIPINWPYVLDSIKKLKGTLNKCFRHYSSQLKTQIILKISLENIKELQLRSNRIYTIDFLPQMELRQLTFINLAQNQITDLEPLTRSDLRSLELLMLSKEEEYSDTNHIQSETFATDFNEKSYLGSITFDQNRFPIVKEIIPRCQFYPGYQLLHEDRLQTYKLYRLIEQSYRKPYASFRHETLLNPRYKTMQAKFNKDNQQHWNIPKNRVDQLSALRRKNDKGVRLKVSQSWWDY